MPASKGGVIDLFQTDCSRCGVYRFTDQAGMALVYERQHSAPGSLLPFAALAALRRFRGQSPPIFVTDSIPNPSAHEDFFTLSAARATFPRFVGDQLDRALSVLADRSRSPGEVVPFDYGNDGPLLCAESERGIRYLMTELERRGLVERMADNTFLLRAEGWRRAEELRRGKADPNSRTVFVAMSYRAAGNEDRETALRAAVGDVAYRPKVVRTEQFTGDIVAEIKAYTRSSRVVVVDLTGTNENVYFEAGFADGLGIRIIYTCEKSDVDAKRVGFNLAHENLLVYESFDQLRERLATRIAALVGRADSAA